MEARLLHRKTKIDDLIVKKLTAIVNRWSHKKADLMAAERFMNNAHVDLAELERLATQPCARYQGGGQVILIQDTSFYCYENVVSKGKKSRFDDEDPYIGRHHKQHNSRGIYAHPVLALEDCTKLPIGLASIHLYSVGVNESDKDQRNYKQQPIESKHSYRWIEGIHRAARNLGGAKRLTAIADREADIYSLLATEYDQRVDLLIRSNYDRRVINANGETMTISRTLSSIGWKGEHTVSVYDKQAPGGQRLVKVKIRFTTVELKRPNSALVDQADYPPTIKITVVEARQFEGLKEREKPVHWILYSTRPIVTLEQAIGSLAEYTQRWWIEDFFRVTKKKGFELESSGFEKGEALRRLMYLVFEQAIKVIALRQGRQNEALPATTVLSEEEVEVLAALAPSHEGHTPSTRCPSPPRSLAWAVWIIAALGGWTPRSMDKRPPGLITLRWGYEKLQTSVMSFRAFSRMVPNNSS